MKIYVIDASVVLTFLLKPESQVSRTVELLLLQSEKEKQTLFAPKLLPIEIANGLRFSTEKEKVQEGFALFLRLPITFMELSSEQIKQALNLSLETDTTVYDASYHLLAFSLSAVFLTCDRKYYEKTKQFGSIELLHL